MWVEEILNDMDIEGEILIEVVMEIQDIVFVGIDIQFVISIGGLDFMFFNVVVEFDYSEEFELDVDDDDFFDEEDLFDIEDGSQLFLFEKECSVFIQKCVRFQR